MTTPLRRKGLRAKAVLATVATAGSLAIAAPAGHAAAATAPSTLTAGHNLTANQKLFSPDGAVELVMQGDGNLVAYGGGRALWSSGTAGHNGAYASMQTDGNLVVRLGTTALWNTGSAGTGTANRLSVQDDGNVVVYTSAIKAVYTARSHMTTLMAGVNLLPGQLLYSPDDKYRLVMQGDGNLVLYTGSTAKWQSNTAGHSGAYASMQTDGNLVVRTSSGALWSTGTAQKGANRLILQSDYNLVLYTPAGKAVWASSTTSSADTSVVAGPITRAQVMTRINYWVNVVKPMYNATVGDHSTYVDDLEGRPYRPDCSGSVAMAWHMEDSFNTHAMNPHDPSFIGLTHEVARSALQPGDALVIDDPNFDGGTDHVALFVRWAGAVGGDVVVDAEPYEGKHEEQETWDASYANHYIPIAYNRISG